MNWVSRSYYDPPKDFLSVSKDLYNKKKSAFKVLFDYKTRKEFSHLIFSWLINYAIFFQVFQ